VEGLDSAGKVLGTPFPFGLNNADTVQVADTVGGPGGGGGGVLWVVLLDGGILSQQGIYLALRGQIYPQRVG